MSEKTNLETAEAVRRAEYGESVANYPAIFDGFEAKGISPDDIRPRENVFTFRVWRAKGRIVEKGQHGVKISTWIKSKKADDKGKRKIFPKTVTVFHVSQTKSA